jgi:hypothetical protein
VLSLQKGRKEEGRSPEVQSLEMCRLHGYFSAEKIYDKLGTSKERIREKYPGAADIDRALYINSVSNR